MSTTSPNPNGHIAIVFTYNGSKYQTYQDFLNAFYVTMPGGGGVTLGADQYYGKTKAIKLGKSYSLTDAISPITDLEPTNTSGNSNLQTALNNWASTQSASKGQASYASLYLSHFTGGRVYLSNGDLNLDSSNEPTPASPTDSAYDRIYDVFEPYIGAQIGSETIPGNLADITDIDWFSFPVTLKAWNYDFSKSAGALTESAIQLGGSGARLYKALDIPASSSQNTNQYPSSAYPAASGTNPDKACRLVGPTMAAAAQSYYTDPATDPFPYHYFDDYLGYLQQSQAAGKTKESKAGLFTLTGDFAGIGAHPTETNIKPQSFRFNVDFSNIKTAIYNYAGNSVSRITPDSTIVFKGYTSEIGSKDSPFKITLPWAKGLATYGLKKNDEVKACDDAVALGWLAFDPGSVPFGASGTYSPVEAVAKDSDDNLIKPLSGTSQLQLIYSVNTDPLSGTPDDLYKNGEGTALALSDIKDIRLTASATYTQPLSTNPAVILIIKTDASGKLASIGIQDIGDGPLMNKGASWTIAKSSAGLGNTKEFSIRLNESPALRNIFVLNSATYSAFPKTLSVAYGATSATGTGFNTFKLSVTSDGASLTGWNPDPDWTTLCQPAGTYGANAGYQISEIQGTNKTFNKEVKSLQNDVFGWVVADLLAALNAGLVGSPVNYPSGSITQEHASDNKTIGESSDCWFSPGDNPYTKGLWGEKAWSGVVYNNKPVNNFWNTWAYAIYSLPEADRTDAYNFAFTDRFVEGILMGYNPPPANPSGEHTVLLEVIIEDSPLF